MIVEFEAAMFRWAARTDADWFFAAVPAHLSEEIRELAGPVTRGFGAVRVRARVGGSSWQTSIFPGADGIYVLPLKRSVREAETLVEGAAVPVRLEVALG
ncbi:DUF1905 domain-containing protein [Microbacterium sp. P04]|uniref:DUF1905 domain-containing protein n=1 Tax=Microbacterium sp. P04 TaxID=3366947 RepID=UPI003746C1E6